MRYQLTNDKGTPIALVSTPAQVCRLVRAGWSIVDIATGKVVPLTDFKAEKIGVYVRVYPEDKDAILKLATQLTADRDQ